MTRARRERGSVGRRGRPVDAVLFDLDGTLVRTEELKAISYGRAAEELSEGRVSEAEVLTCYKEVVGLARRRVAQTILERFGLVEVAKSRCSALGVAEPWQAYLHLRLRLYDAMLADEELLRGHVWPHALELLRIVRGRGYPLGLATMSGASAARRVLRALLLTRAFDAVLTSDDVGAGKPDPEIYQRLAAEVGADPQRCLVVEDSPAGADAALAAGARVVTVATPFSRERLQARPSRDREWYVDDPAHVVQVVERLLDARPVLGGGVRGRPERTGKRPGPESGAGQPPGPGSGVGPS